MSSFRTFADRDVAAEALARGLHAYRGSNPLILAIPRGAVPMGKVIAEQLAGELDLVLVHKLCAPFDPECAVGSIDETGWTYLDPQLPANLKTGFMLEHEKTRQLAALQRRRALYTPHLEPADPKGRTTIIVDDGLATGATMMAALHTIRAREPAELICAVPVAATQSLERVLPVADKVVCLHATPSLGAVSHYYTHYRQVEDDEVKEILESFRRSFVRPQNTKGGAPRHP